MDKIQIVGEEQIERSRLLIRGQKVLLDVDLTELYGIPTKALNQAVRRNLQRFRLISCFSWKHRKSLLCGHKL